MATNSIISYGNTVSGIRSGDSASIRESRIFIDPDALRQPEYTVYLHSISRRNFNQPNGIYRNVAIPACPKEKRSYCFMRVQHPVQQPHLNPHDVNGAPVWATDNAKSVALGICNPNYAGRDLDIQDKDLNPESVTASGECNLNRQGIFASMNAEPTEEELKKAEARRETYYRQCIQDADAMERSNPKLLQERLTEDHHMAAEYFGLDANWHRAPSAKIDCPNCGQKIPKTASFHYDNGRICILNWEAAWLAGAVKKDDVPEPKRWWSEGNKGVFVPEIGLMSKEQLQQYAKDKGIEIDLRWSKETLIEKIS